MLYNTTEESHAVEYVALVATTEEPPAKEQVAYQSRSPPTAAPNNSDGNN